MPTHRHRLWRHQIVDRRGTRSIGTNNKIAHRRFKTHIDNWQRAGNKESALCNAPLQFGNCGDRDAVNGDFILHGAGWGHGVGLCQIGAAVMGEKGFGYKEILSHYFKNTIIEKRW